MHTKNKVLAGAGVAGVGALSTLLAPAAHADTAPLLDLPDLPQGVADFLPNAPQPVAPAAPLQQLMTVAQGVAPSNLLRTNSSGAGGDAAEAPTGAVAESLHADTLAPSLLPDRDQVTTALHNYADAPLQKISEEWLTSMDGRYDSNTLGQAFAAWQLPNAATMDAVGEAVGTLVEKVQSGDIVNDFNEALSNTMHSDLYEDFRTNTDDIFGTDRNLRGTDYAAASLARLTDTFALNPARAIQDVVEAAGGVGNILTNPVMAFVRAGTQIFGSDFMLDLGDFLTRDLPNALGQAFTDALPALLAIPAGGLLGAVLGGLEGAIWGAPIGALLGALNPLNLLGIPLGAIPGAIIGAFATGIPGFIGSLLLTLPTLVIFPLLGAMGASALLLAVAATIIFGGWLLIAGSLALLLGLGLGIVGFTFTTVFLLAIALLFPQSLLSAPGAGILVFLVVFPITFATIITLTAWIPVVLYLLVVPYLLVGALPAGLGLGLLAAGITTMLGIPLITALSAIPGAILGAITGGWTGFAIAEILSTIGGAIAGAIVGALIGAGIGGSIGAALGALVALPVGIALFLNSLNNWWIDANGDPDSLPSQLREAFDRGWRESKLGRLFGMFENELWNTESGQALKNILDRVTSLFKVMAFLDQRKLTEMLARGGLLGAVPGWFAGSIPGGIVGFILGLLDPRNFIPGIIMAIATAIPGAVTGAALGKGLGDLLGLLTGLGSIPLTYLPNLLGLGLLWTLAGLLPLTAWAATLVPPLALAFAAWMITALVFSIPGLLVTLVSTTTTILFHLGMGLIVLGVLLLPILPVGGALIGIGATMLGVFSALTGIPATLAGILLFAAFVLAFIVAAVPVFLITALFFTFPALGLTALWLAGYPFLLPMALGLSLLEGVAIGSLVDALSSLLTVPLGALIGAALGTIPGFLFGTGFSALMRAIQGAIIGGLVGGVAGAGVGGLIGAITALLTHLRFDSGNFETGTQWVDLRVLNQGGFGDVLSFIPQLSGERVNVLSRPGVTAVPHAAAPKVTESSLVARGERSLVDVTDMVLV